eukprot:scaffold17000_cov54-Cyclotella_meneghiniana.AAC.1
MNHDDQWLSNHRPSSTRTHRPSIHRPNKQRGEEQIIICPAAHRIDISIIHLPASCTNPSCRRGRNCKDSLERPSGRLLQQQRPDTILPAIILARGEIGRDCVDLCHACHFHETLNMYRFIRISYDAYKQLNDIRKKLFRRMMVSHGTAAVVAGAEQIDLTKEYRNNGLFINILVILVIEGTNTLET